MKRVIAGAVVASMVAMNVYAESAAKPESKTPAKNEVAATKEVTKKEALGAKNEAAPSTEAKPAVQPVSGEESWTGKIEKKDATNVEFVADGKHYDITGAAEKELLKESGKEMKITGKMTDDKSIEVVKAEPVTAVK
jgi:hypothetical protein